MLVLNIACASLIGCDGDSEILPWQQRLSWVIEVYQLAIRASHLEEEVALTTILGLIGENNEILEIDLART